MITDIILPYLNTHGILISFLGGFITGETVIISLAFLSANGFLPVWQVLVFCLLGMYFSDFVPFLIGRHKWFVKLFNRKGFSKRGRIIEDHLLSYTHNNLFLTLLYTKFIYGASIPALIYLGSRKKPYFQFCFYNFLVELIFVPFVVLVGWLSGSGFKIVNTIFKDFKIALLFLMIILFLIVYFMRFIDKKITKGKI